MYTRSLLATLVLITACSPREVTEITPELEAVVEANNRFSLDLYQAVDAAVDEDNLFLSPFSVSAALSMTYAGAEGNTEEEMAAVLHVDDEDAHHKNLGLLVQDLGGLHPGRSYQLYTANRIFGQQGTSWKDPFLDVTEQDYAAPLEELDFRGDPEGSRTTINDWGAEQTRGTIEDVLPPGSISSDTRLALANAIYFKGDWLNAFDTADTRERPFTLSDDSVVEVPTMAGELDVLVGGDEEVTVLGIPYEDEELAFWVVMPSGEASLENLEAELDADSLAGWMDGAYTMDELWVEMPKFELRNQLALKDSLVALGMVDAFGGADFSGMSEEMDLVLDDVHHQAFVKVDEEGTTAAAVTVVVANETSASMPVVVDRPFLFFIRDELTGTVLFMGRLGDPSAAPVGD